jgi:hypothetical protein
VDGLRVPALAYGIEAIDGKPLRLRQAIHRIMNAYKVWRDIQKPGFRDNSSARNDSGSRMGRLIEHFCTSLRLIGSADLVLRILSHAGCPTCGVQSILSGGFRILRCIFRALRAGLGSSGRSIHRGHVGTASGDQDQSCERSDVAGLHSACFLAAFRFGSKRFFLKLNMQIQKAQTYCYRKIIVICGTYDSLSRRAFSYSVREWLARWMPLRGDSFHGPEYDRGNCSS